MEVIFKTDPLLVDLGFQGEDAYATDEHGNFIPEGIRIRNGKMALRWLSRKRPEIWCKPPKRRKRGMQQSGNVLVIGQTTKKPHGNSAASVKARKLQDALSRMSSGEPKPNLLCNSSMAACRTINPEKSGIAVHSCLKSSPATHVNHYRWELDPV